MPHPTVSICLPSYNHARYLPEAMDSVVAQTYSDFELIVVDDGSRDGSLDILRRYEAANPGQIRVLTHPGHANLGISRTANLALEHARGRYWCGMCSDDAWYPDKLKREVALMERTANLGFVYSRADLMDDESVLLGGRVGVDLSSDRNPVASLIMTNAVPALTVMARTECINEVGLVDNSLVYSDWDLWLKILARWDVGYIDRPLAKYRVHSSNSSIGISRTHHIRHMKDLMNALASNASVIGGRLGTSEARACIELQLAHLAFCEDNQEEAGGLLKSAFHVDPDLALRIDELAVWFSLQQAAEYSPEPESGRDFASWLHDHLVALLGKAGADRVHRRLEGNRHATKAFRSFVTSPDEANRSALASFRADPRRLAEWRLVVIFLLSSLGPRATRTAASLRDWFAR
jgi:hypothetical protein